MFKQESRKAEKQIERKKYQRRKVKTLKNGNIEKQTH